MFCRTGNLAKLSVKYFDQNKKEQTITNERLLEQHIRNPRIILNKDSDLVVGGVPSKMTLPSQVDAVNYTGCFDGLQVNNHFVGSWNSDVSYETISVYITCSLIVSNSLPYGSTNRVVAKKNVTHFHDLIFLGGGGGTRLYIIKKFSFSHTQKEISRFKPIMR